MDSKEKLIKLLNTGLKATQTELRRKLGLRSERQVRRLLRQLREGDIPLQEERSGRYKHYFLKPEHQRRATRPIWLDDEEMMAVVVAVQAARAALAPTPFQGPLQAAFEKLLADWAPRAITFEPEAEAHHWHFGEARSVDLNPATFRAVVRAIRNRQSLRMDYFTASRQELTKDRKVDPLLLGVRGGAWLLAAYCHRSQGMRDFSLAGIRRIAPCDEAQEQAFFASPEDFDRTTYFRDRFGALAGKEVYTVRLLVEPDRVPYFRRKQYHPTQQIHDERDDGRVVVSFEVEGLQDVRAFARSWGPGVKVLDPPRLARQVARDVQQAAALYERDDD